MTTELMTTSPATELQTAKPTLIGLNLAQLSQLVKELGEPGFRAQQLHSWLYVKTVRSYEEMSNLSKAFKQDLAKKYDVGQLKLDQVQQSVDGTKKYLFELFDGKKVESVLMPYQEKGSYAVCLSTQVGCAVNCDFCATGKIGFKRNLSAAEIVEQLLWIRHESQLPIKNVVLMGQGEPLLNYDNTLEAIRLLNQSAEIGMRHITLSTSGIIPGIDKLADEQLPITLALSLHGPDNETRNKIMPINLKYPVEQLIPSLHHYFYKTHRRVTIEYILIAGVNDSDVQAQKLAKLLKGLRCYINLIPYNNIGEEYGYQKPSGNRTHAFRQILQAAGFTVTVRLERGADIAAACGQLHNQAEKRAEKTLFPTG